MPDDALRPNPDRVAAATGTRRGRGRTAPVAASASGAAFDILAAWPPNDPAAAGIRPSPPSTIPADFVETVYLACNPDVDDAVARGAWASGAAHWQARGWSEARPTLPHPQGLAPAPAPDWLRPGPETDGFDAEGYLSLYPDLTRALGADLAAARDHFVSFGRREGRIGPGAAPYIRRRPSLDALLALPFGLDVYAPFADAGARGSQARQLVRDLLAAGLPVRARAFALSPRGPRIAIREQSRPPVHRVGLILAEPPELAALHCLYPVGHFASSYVIAAWSTEPSAFRPDWFAVFGAIDELWVADLEAEAGYLASAPVPVQAVALPLPAIAATVVADDGAGPIVVLCNGAGDTAARLAVLALDAVAAAVASLGRAAPRLQVVVPQASPDPALLAAVQEALARTRGSAGEAAPTSAPVITEPLSDAVLARLAGSGRLLLALADGPDSLLAGCTFADAGKAVVVLAGTPLARRLGDRAQAAPACHETRVPTATLIPRRMPSVMPDPAALPATLLQAITAPQPGAARDPRRPPPVQAIRRRLEALGLDIRVPPFLAGLGRSSTLRVPPIAAELSRQDWPRLAGLRRRASFGALLPIARADAVDLRRCVFQVLDQRYPFWTLSLVDDRSAGGDVRRLIEELRGSHPQLRVESVPPGLDVAEQLNLAAQRSADTHLLLLRPQDLLEPGALMEIAAGLDVEPPPALLYADAAGSNIDQPAERRPTFSPDRLRSEDCIGQLLVVERAAWNGMNGLAAGYGSACGFELALRLMEAAAPILHLPHVVVRHPALEQDPASELLALQAHAGRSGGRIEPGRAPGRHRFRPAARPSSQISVVVTEAAGGQAAPAGATVALVRALRRQLPADGGEILLMHDIGTLGRADAAALQAHAVRFEAVPALAGNRVALRMLGITRSTHPLLLFVEAGQAPGPDLVEALLEAAHDPAVAAVGVRLPPSLQRPDKPDRLLNVSAVSGGCLLVRRDGARIVRGFDQSMTTDTGCDVDFCFRLRAAGLRIVYTPYGDAGPAPSALPIEDELVQAQLGAVWMEPTLQAIDGNQLPRRRPASPS